MINNELKSNFSTGTVNYGQCNPHGIDTILSRRTAAQAALNTLTSSNSNSSPPNSTSENGSSGTTNTSSNNGSNPAPASVNPYFKLEDLHQAAAAAAQIANQRQNSQNLYWPGIQGLISNPHIWRERFNGKSTTQSHRSKSSFFVQKFYFDFPRKLSTLFG